MNVKPLRHHPRRTIEQARADAAEQLRAWEPQAWLGPLPVHKAASDAEMNAEADRAAGRMIERVMKSTRR